MLRIALIFLLQPYFAFAIEGCRTQLEQEPLEQEVADWEAQNKNSSTLYQRQLEYEELRRGLILHHRLLTQSRSRDEVLGSDIMLANGETVKGEDIVYAKILHVSDRPFAKREEIRQLMMKHFGQHWFPDGKALLADLAESRRTRDSLDSEERFLADGSFYFLKCDSHFEEAEYYEGLLYSSQLSLEYGIAMLEFDINNIRKQFGLPFIIPALKGFNPNNFAEALENLKEKYVRESQNLVESKKQFLELERLLAKLREAGAYPEALFRIRTILKIDAYFRLLGYGDSPLLDP